jgi:hypothetical protein
MATSPLFGWEEPDDTDLVKDGAAAIRTLGNAIDTSMGDLLGGTTGQVLSKASNTNMDFTWVTSDDANAIQNTIVDAKGDLISATGSDVPARLAVGANNTLLVANSSTATGLEWQGAWQAWTPTYANLTVGNGTTVARYQQIGKTVSFEIRFTLGSTSAIGTTPSFTLPVTASLSSATYLALFGDATATNHIGGVDCNATTAFLYATNTSTAVAFVSYLTATVPFTWTTSDYFVVRGTYEAA